MGGATVQLCMSGIFVRGLVASLTLIGLTSVALADDWKAVRLRGDVFVYRDGWVKLERGDVVADDSIIRTLGRGRVSFERGAETIDLLPNSQIRIVDQTGRKFTTVMSDYGGVEIDAEALNVEHFSVATPFLAAVVKGTHFSVTSDGNGSEVSVERGRVLVEDSSSHDTVTIVAGQTASTEPSGSSETLIVTGTPSGNTNAHVGASSPAVGTPNTGAAHTPAPVSSTSKPPSGDDDESEDEGSEDNGTDGPGNDNGNNGNHNGNDNNSPGNDNENNGNHYGQDKGNKGSNKKD